MQLGRQNLRDVCRINLDTVLQQGRLMEWQVFCYTDRFFPCLKFWQSFVEEEITSRQPKARH